jgi:anti-sigma factor RsiW
MDPAQGQELDCRDLAELVTDYLEGALGDAAVSALERHLVACDGCAAYLEQMRGTIAALAALRR